MNNKVETIDTLDFFGLDDDEPEDEDDINAIWPHVNDDIDETDEQMRDDIENQVHETVPIEPADDDLDEYLDQTLVEDANSDFNEYDFAAEDDMDEEFSIDPDEDEIANEATVQPDNSKEETIEFNRAEEIDFEQLDPAIFGDEGEDLLDETLVVNLKDGVDRDLFDGRILHFPGSQSEDEKFSEFESEIGMTLQAIRDQIQQMNERLFSQERSSSNLKKTISEIIEIGNFQSQEETKKSN
jgi:hypothetical protein